MSGWETARRDEAARGVDRYAVRRALEALEADARGAGDLERAGHYRAALDSGDGARMAQIVSAARWIRGMLRAGYVRDADGAWIKPCAVCGDAHTTAEHTAPLDHIPTDLA